MTHGPQHDPGHVYSYPVYTGTRRPRGTDDPLHSVHMCRTPREARATFPFSNTHYTVVVGLRVLDFGWGGRTYWNSSSPVERFGVQKQTFYLGKGDGESQRSCTVHHPGPHPLKPYPHLSSRMRPLPGRDLFQTRSPEPTTERTSSQYPCTPPGGPCRPSLHVVKEYWTIPSPPIPVSLGPLNRTRK